jgi:hypothetical protein
MADSMSKSLEVQEILNSYTKIHKDIFKPSLRRIIPIPKLYKPINYDGHVESLAGLAKRLGKVVSKIPDGTEYGNALKDYGEALLKTILLLRGICSKLYKSSQRKNPVLYPKAQYKTDLKDYESNVDRLMQLGRRLNELQRAEEATLEQ